MTSLSKQAQKLIEDIEKKIETLPAAEKNIVTRNMTTHLSALNEDVKHLLKSLQDLRDEDPADLHSKTLGNDLNHISDFI
jgi:hypothetical protein